MTTTRDADFGTLPPHLLYLREPATKYGIYVFQEDRNRLARELSPSEQEQLAKLADRVWEPDEAERIWEWRQQNKGKPEQDLVAYLLQVLKDVIPYIPKYPENLAWESLPRQLEYIREPASKYGRNWLSVDRDRLLENMTQQEYERLKALAVHIRTPEAEEAIQQWLMINPPYSEAHPEATLVQILLEIIDEFVPEQSS